jgi:hypothetical protein
LTHNNFFGVRQIRKHFRSPATRAVRFNEAGRRNKMAPGSDPRAVC